MKERDEFYVGHLPKAPRGLGGTMTRVVAALLTGGIGLALLLIAGQRPFPTATFEYGQERTFSGVLGQRPYPHIQVDSKTMLLVAPGKHGVSLEGEGPVRLVGSLIQRDGTTMIEVRPGTVEFTGPRSVPVPGVETPGVPVTLTGEIVDSKCYLGVMNPGQGKVHRDCAARCISGGVPPAFLVRDADSRTQLLLLASDDGHPLNREISNLVAEPVRITGTLVRSGSVPVLRTDRARIHRVTE